MELAIIVLLAIVSLVAWLWLVVRIWKISAPGAIFTFFLGLPAFYFLFKYWGDAENDIRAPFFTNLVITLFYFMALITFPSYQSIGMESDTAAHETKSTRSNPVMEKWCSDEFDAAYDEGLGTCIERDANQAVADASATLDVMGRLGSHYLKNGLETRLSEIDESSPGARNFSKMPEMQRVMQFEFKSDSVMPTLAMIAECASSEDCGRIERRLDQPDAPFSVARNGKLLFMGLRMFGEDPVIEEAKELFMSFEAS